MEIEIITTDDGSNSLFVKDLNESYHSRFGAINESLHVYIQAGLKVTEKGSTGLNLLEIGFGTGLNAFLTFLEGQKRQTKINYFAIEPYLLKESVYSKLNFPALLEKEEFCNVFHSMHKCPNDESVKIAQNFNLYKINKKLETLVLKKDFFSLVYFDAFAPDIQPELWSQEIFHKVYEAMMADGILVTYSAKGSVRRAMQGAGFKVERLSGPKGKREILRATK